MKPREYQQRRANDLGRRICELWGLDNHGVSRVSLDLNGRNVPTLTVQFLIEDTDGLFEELRAYRLVPIDESENT